MQQFGRVGFGDILRIYGGIVGLNPPNIVYHGDVM
jgi:hypothetical protein